MKHAINMPTSLHAAIKELGPYIRDDELSYRIKSYDGLLVREALGNWLLCAVLNDRNPDPNRYTFTTEPRDGPGADGAILDKTTGEARATEHVMVAKRRDGQRPKESAEQLVLAMVEKKLAKYGAASASSLVLVVYLDADVAGYDPWALRAQLPADLAFAGSWLVVPQAGRWEYDVVSFVEGAPEPYRSRVTITEAFDDWSVKRTVWLTETTDA